MLARPRDDDQGFTLVELLVVIIIIGILSAIAIPIFLKQRQKAFEAGMKSDLRTMATQLESYSSDYDAYPLGLDGSTFQTSAAIGNEVAKLTNANTIQLTFNTTFDAYCLKASNPKAGRSWFYISNKGGLQKISTTACGSF